ncbi:hypothetical protein KKF91_03645 [Myxococcota bacterium]|nr:hypothetical protein [Myxococcota bacterium]MBU1429636.1 hypothetical protein [Myxococcota bacterium]MBU1899725.1 hypothetical protein [Myxococcota bacterium]
MNPIFIATLLSILLVLSGLKPRLPGVILDVARMLGALALPLVMILIGGNLYVDFKRRGQLRGRLILAFLALRNVIFPAVIFALLLATRPPPKIAFLIFLMTIVPPLTAIPIIVERARGDVPVSNQLVIASLGLSILSVPAWLMLFNRAFELL